MWNKLPAATKKKYDETAALWNALQPDEDEQRRYVSFPQEMLRQPYPLAQELPQQHDRGIPGVRAIRLEGYADPRRNHVGTGSRGRADRMRCVSSPAVGHSVLLTPRRQDFNHELGGGRKMTDFYPDGLGPDANARWKGYMANLFSESEPGLQLLPSDKYCRRRHATR